MGSLTTICPIAFSAWIIAYRHVGYMGVYLCLELEKYIASAASAKCTILE